MKEEDNFGDADVPIAIVPNTGEIVLLQMDGHLTQEELDKSIEMSIDARSDIHKYQIEALERRYSSGNDGDAGKSASAKKTEVN